MQSELCLHLRHSDRQIYVMKISIQEDGRWRTNDEVPMEPDEQQANNQDEQPREPPVAQPNQPPNEIAPMHRKITRLLGKTDEMQPLLSSTRGMIHTMDQRTITIKNLVDTCLDGLEELFDLHKKLLQELQDQGVLKDKNNSNSKRKASRSPSLAQAESKIRPNQKDALFVKVIITHLIVPK
ncbi:hypothetical protein Aduo_005921 [Ancylostoma duodenale]